MLRKGYDAGDGVNEPTQHYLVGCPGAIALQKILD
jgi:hypothetical protein